MNLKFGETCKLLRKEKGYTQERVAEILGVSSQSVSRWETGICYPDLEMLPAIANLLGVTVDRLLANDTASQEEDQRRFLEAMNNARYTGEEQIAFIRDFCRKYPENKQYAYELVHAIAAYLLEEPERACAYMPLLKKNAEGLLETQFRSLVIQIMACVCEENELPAWLALAPYDANTNRRGLLVARAQARRDNDQIYIQQGLEMLENLSAQLDRRFPDRKGPAAKAAFHRGVMQTIRSFGTGGEVPAGWQGFYARKQLVLAACLFAAGKTGEGWQEFEEAMSTYRAVCSRRDAWLDLGSRLFSGMRISPDWQHAIDESDTVHRLFGTQRYAQQGAAHVHELLTNPRFSWFDTARPDPRYREALAFLEEQINKDKETDR